METVPAIHFILTTGNAIERARLEFLLTGSPAAQGTKEALFAGQRADGGFPPFWADDYSSLDATCYRLAQAEQLGIEPTEAAVIRAASFLEQRQSSDGSWEEGPSVAGQAPPWVQPGDLNARLYLTANSGFWLALAGLSSPQPSPRKAEGESGVKEPSPPGVVGAIRAAKFLTGYLAPDGALPGYLHTHWLAGGLWYRAGWYEPAERVFGFLRSEINRLAASNLSWLIATLSAAGVPFVHPLMSEAAAQLEQSQEIDGRWSSEDGPGQDVHATLEALRALALSERVKQPLVVSKVFAYLIRSHQGNPELLVFDSLDEPGFEVPKGKVEPGESLEKAVRREIQEETGLTQVEILKRVGSVVWQDEWQTYFLVRCQQATPDVFVHQVSGAGGDAGKRYQYHWLPLTDELEAKLVQGSQAFFKQLAGEVRPGGWW